MAAIRQCIHAEIDLSRDPVQELSTVIAAVLQTWPGKEREILAKLKGEIQHTLDHLDKEDDKRGKQIR